MLKQALSIILATSITTSLLAEWSPYNKLSERKNTTIYVASIQFPAIIKQLPSVRAFFDGNIVNCEQDGNRVVLTFSADRNTRKLNVLVVEKSSFEVEEKTNTVKHLKIKPSDAYKFWSLELMHKQNTEAIAHKLVGGIKLNSDEKSPYYWVINKNVIDPTGKVPGHTLVIIYDPELFTPDLEGDGSSVELPKFVITSNISEADLNELSTRCLISALELAPIHARYECTVHHPTANRDRVMIATT